MNCTRSSDYLTCLFDYIHRYALLVLIMLSFYLPSQSWVVHDSYSRSEHWFNYYARAKPVLSNKHPENLCRQDQYNAVGTTPFRSSMSLLRNKCPKQNFASVSLSIELLIQKCRLGLFTITMSKDKFLGKT